MVQSKTASLTSPVGKEPPKAVAAVGSGLRLPTSATRADATGQDDDLNVSRAPLDSSDGVNARPVIL